ncbi:MAG: insulinase family protein [Gemmatimonadaceae bacterium]|nr:insulinase family protein [Gemmatimonadaceae bacterium]
MTHLPNSVHARHFLNVLKGFTVICAVVFVAAATLGVLTARARVANAQAPTTAPAPLPLRPATMPPFQEATLANGVRVVLVENHRTPLVVFRLALPAGTAFDPVGKTGTATMVASLLTQGAGARSADEVAAAIEGVGGLMIAAADDDFLSVYGSTLSNHAPLALGLLGDAVARPAFHEKELELVRARTLSTLQLSAGSPAALASKFFRAGLYGAHPYGASATPTTVRAITRADVQQFHASRVRPRGALLVVAGDITLAQLTTLANAAFAGWTGAPVGVATTPAPPLRSRPEIVLVHRPGAVQSNVLMGNLVPGPMDGTRMAAEVATQVVGGGSDGRLFRILREQKGWTYGAYASLSRPRGTARFEASADVRTEVTDSTVREMRAQLERLSTEPIPQAELDDKRNGMVGSFPLAVETPQGMAELVAMVKQYGLPNDYLATYRQKMSVLTPAQVSMAARRVVRPQEALVVVVGDGVKLYDKLATIAPVTLRTTDGDPLQPTDLAPKTVLQNFDLSKLVPRKDSFVVLVQGQAAGYVAVDVESVEGGWLVRERTDLMGGVVTQRSTLRNDATLAPVSIEQTGSMQGQQTGAQLSYRDGRAKGTVRAPTPTGIEAREVDAELPKGTLAAEALQLALPLFRWADGARFTVSIFNSAKRATETLTLTVIGSESVTVPAGTFECWKIEQTGGDAPVIYHLAKNPTRLIKISPVGQPIEIRLAK